MLKSILKMISHISVASLFRFQLKIINFVSFGKVPFSAIQAPGQLLSLKSGHQPAFITSFGIGYVIVFLVYISAIFKVDKTGQSQISGDSLFILSLFTGRLILTIPVVKFVNNNYTEFALLCNSLLQIRHVRSSHMFRLVAFCTPFVSLFVSVLYVVVGVLFAVSDTNLSTSSTWFEKTASALLTVYDVWSFSHITSLSAFLSYSGLFLSYISMYRLIMFVYNRSRSRTSFCNVFRNSFISYKQLQVYTALANFCFKETLAVPVKLTFVTVSILFGTIVIDPKLRSVTSTPALIFDLYVVVLAYGLGTVGYGLPGQVNWISKQVLKSWKRRLVLWPTNKRFKRKTMELKKILDGMMDIRIEFGKSNYYGRSTSFVLLRFVVECTVNLIIYV